jgi:hypothetical protein
LVRRTRKPSKAVACFISTVASRRGASGARCAPQSAACIRYTLWPRQIGTRSSGVGSLFRLAPGLMQALA